MNSLKAVLQPDGTWKTEYKTYTYSAEPTSNKTGTVQDPPTGEGCTVIEGLTQLGQTTTLSSGLSSTQPLTSSCKPLTLDVILEAAEKVWKEMGNPYVVLPAELASYWKPKSEAPESLNGSSKRKRTRKSTFENGIL